MWVQVLGSGCSAGFPSWNEGSAAAERARENDSSMPIREAAALAVSADGEHYSILEAPLLRTSKPPDRRNLPSAHDRKVPQLHQFPS